MCVYIYIYIYGKVGFAHKLKKEDGMKWFQTKFDGQPRERGAGLVFASETDVRTLQRERQATQPREGGRERSRAKARERERERDSHSQASSSTTERPAAASQWRELCAGGEKETPPLLDEFRMQARLVLVALSLSLFSLLSLSLFSLSLSPLSPLSLSLFVRPGSVSSAALEIHLEEAVARDISLPGTAVANLPSCRILPLQPVL